MSIEMKFQELYRPMPHALFMQRRTRDPGSHLLIGNTKEWGCKQGEKETTLVTPGILLTTLCAMGDYGLRSVSTTVTTL